MTTIKVLPTCDWSIDDQRETCPWFNWIEDFYGNRAGCSCQINPKLQKVMFDDLPALSEQDKLACACMILQRTCRLKKILARMREE